ncbi:MAG TPA: formylglycine-generating enzyme family protein [Pyrinomonadaceae bacterium]
MRLLAAIATLTTSLILSFAILPRHSDLSETRNQVSTDRQRAEAAIEQLKRGERPDQVWQLLSHTSNPTVRSYLVNSFAKLQVDPRLIVARLKVEKETSARRALILSLGAYDRQHLSPPEWSRLIVLLRNWYVSDSDAGIHSAIEWSLRRWDVGTDLQRYDHSLAGRKPQLKNWYVTRETQTIVVIRNPPEFTAGSVDEPGRTPDETIHRVRIPRSFAVGTKEITVGQFQRFLAANPKLEMRYPDSVKDPHRGSPVMNSHSPEDECPQIAVTWYEAAQYCNWLSQREGIPQSEWVYPTDLNDIKSGMTLPANYLQRTGYRLLTEAEWEFAARAGSTTSRFYGESEDLLGEYAVYARNPPKKKGDPNDPNDPQRTARVGQLKPNDLGLFDIYGNVWEWIHDRRVEYPANILHVDVEDKVLVVNDGQWRMRRGGSFTYDATFMRSAHRGRPDGYLPNERRDSVGFRIGRTIGTAPY